MNYKLLLIFIFSLLFACDQNNNKSINLNKGIKYKNKGFALIYKNNLKKENKISKTIDSRSLFIFHKSLEKNSLVKITNPVNQKAVIAKVVSNKVIFSEFYNCVITDRIAEELLLDFDEPFVELILISQNSTFIAKKTKTFDEEKNVAEKVPVDGIKIDNLSTSKKSDNIKKKKSFKYSIKIADFYYKQSAKNMIQRILNETSLKNPLIKKITNTKYRVLIGPFNDIKKLENSFNEIKSLNFENIEILKNV